MAQTRSTAVPPPDESGQAPVLRVATVFEDDTAARCAQRLIGRILSNCDLTVKQFSWGFSVFEQPTGMATAARRANAADVLVVAAWSDTQAAQKVSEWLQHWLAPRREKGGALVSISLDRPQTAAAALPLEERLAHFARQLGMDFFSTHVSAVAASRPLDDLSSPPHEFRLDATRFLAPDAQARAYRR